MKTGEYFNNYVDKNGDLEAIHLKHPIRRYLREDEKDDSKYYSIKSRYLVIPNIDIVNINFRYFNKTEMDESKLSEKDKNQAIEL